MRISVQLLWRKWKNAILILTIWTVIKSKHFSLFHFLFLRIEIILLDVEMDLTEPMDLLDSDSFTCIIDKGTLDCVACSDTYSKKAKQMLDNVYRILAPGGCYICVSYGKPETRMIYLRDPSFKWQVDIQKI